jgi:uncharacterized membrane protein YczE
VLDAPRIRGPILARSLSLLFGLALFALGIVLLYESHLGLSPWDVLNQGIAKHSPLSFGTANIVVALALLVVARWLPARIGPGTVANAVLIGVFVDLYLRTGPIRALGNQALAVRAVLLVGGIAVVAAGSAFYIGGALGAGPRDTLMLGLARRTRTRIGIVRAALEASATATGFALGGTVGIGTLAFALGIGPLVEVAFATLARSPLAEPALEPAAVEGY